MKKTRSDSIGLLTPRPLPAESRVYVFVPIQPEVHHSVRQELVAARAARDFFSIFFSHAHAHKEPKRKKKERESMIKFYKRILTWLINTVCHRGIVCEQPRPMLTEVPLEYSGVIRRQAILSCPRCLQHKLFIS